MEKDVVCGMSFDEKSAAVKVEYKAKTYFFCAQSCKEKFKRAPDKYLDNLDGPQVAAQVRETEKQEAVPVGKQDLRRLDLPISGMSCATCVAKVKKGLSQLEGVVEECSEHCQHENRFAGFWLNATVTLTNRLVGPTVVLNPKLHGPKRIPGSILVG